LLSFLHLSLTKERSPRAARAAGEVSLNSLVPQALRTGCEGRPRDLSPALSLDKERVSEDKERVSEDKERVSEDKES
jgi:hypothetical protein